MESFVRIEPIGMLSAIRWDRTGQEKETTLLILARLLFVRPISYRIGLGSDRILLPTYKGNLCIYLDIYSLCLFIDFCYKVPHSIWHHALGGVFLLPFFGFLPFLFDERYDFEGYL